MNSKIANDGYFNTVVATTGIFAKLVIDDIIVDEITIESLDVVGNATFGKNIIMAKTLGPQGLTGQGQLLQGTGTLLHTFGVSNLFLGNGSGTSGNFTTTGTDNIGIGENSLKALTTGNGNVGIGDNTLLAVTTGSSNIALGAQSGLKTTTGNNNTFIGNDGSEGTATESGIIRIGQIGTHVATYISGTTFVTTQQFGGDVAGSGIITGALIAKGIITASGTPITFDTGANIELAIPSLPDAVFGQTLRLLITNTTAAAVLLKDAAGITISSGANTEVPLKGSRLVYLQRTGAGTFTVY